VAKFTGKDRYKRAQVIWAKRAAKLKEEQPQSFRQAMNQVLKVSKQELDALVYATRNGSGDRYLKKAEHLVFPSSSRNVQSALLVNDASSEWKGVRTYYAWYVALGHRAADKGSKYFAWMFDPSAVRPTTFKEWLAVRAAGTGMITHKIKAMAGRPWREAAKRQAGILINQAAANARKKAMGG
jgi:hypothetical protein